MWVHLFLACATFETEGSNSTARESTIAGGTPTGFCLVSWFIWSHFCCRWKDIMFYGSYLRYQRGEVINNWDRLWVRTFTQVYNSIWRYFHLSGHQYPDWRFMLFGSHVARAHNKYPFDLGEQPHCWRHHCHWRKTRDGPWFSDRNVHRAKITQSVLTYEKFQRIHTELYCNPSPQQYTHFIIELPLYITVLYEAPTCVQWSFMGRPSLIRNDEFYWRPIVGKSDNTAIDFVQ